MARKGENIYKRRDGRWEGRYIFAYTEFGKAKYKYVYAKSYSDVKKKLMLARTNLNTPNSSILSKSKNNYEYWLDEWLNSKKNIVKDSTYIRYNNMVENHIKPKLGSYRINRISTQVMSNYINHELSSGKLDGSGGLSVKTVSDILVIIKGSFKFAQRNEETSDCNFERISLKKSYHEMRVLSKSEEQKLLRVLFDEMDTYKLGVLICLCTGIRIGELCALQWENISFADKTLHIEHTMQRIQKLDGDSVIKTRISITEPKSFSGTRTIPIPDFLINELNTFFTSQNAFVLSGENKHLIEPRIMQNKFKTFLSTANIDDANFHALRHTFATRCVEVGFDIKTLSEILGHSSVKITLDKYVHSSLEQKRNNMEKLKCIVEDYQSISRQ